MDQIPTASDRAALLVAVPSALLAFWIGFNLGVFDDIFFDQVLAVWVTATVVLVASLVSKLPPRTWLGRLVLLVPTMWLIAAMVVDPGDSGGSTDVLFIITVVVTVVTLPFIGWILVTAIKKPVTRLLVLASLGESAWAQWWAQWCPLSPKTPSGLGSVLRSALGSERSPGQFSMRIGRSTPFRSQCGKSPFA
jgi:hypothetical protein